MSEFAPSPSLIALAKHARHKADLARTPAEKHEAQLWSQIADEIESYISEPTQQPDLFGTSA